eukprot:m.228531 g.228531  ORF g.228531 m.228531 type:complete len:1010 (-) comp11757_c0_seq1:143-3172(-)
MAEPGKGPARPKAKMGALPAGIKDIAKRMPGQMRKGGTRNGPARVNDANGETIPVPTSRPQRTGVKPPPDEELLKGLPELFYTPEFDPKKATLADVKLDSTDIDPYRRKRTLELQAVSRKLSGLVQSHHQEFVRELTRVSQLQEDLETTTKTCQTAKRHLSHAETVVKKDLAILQRYRKMTRLQAMLNGAELILAYNKAPERITKKLESKDVLGAIDIWRNLADKAPILKQFECIADFDGYVQGLRDSIEDHMERSLKLLCGPQFAVQQYEIIMSGYKALDMQREAVEKVQLNFGVVINNLVRNTVLRVVSAGGKEVPIEEFRGVPVKEILKRLPQASFEDCLVDVCRAVCRIMVIFARICRWHTKQGQGSTHRRTRSDDTTAATFGAAPTSGAAPGPPETPARTPGTTLTEPLTPSMTSLAAAAGSDPSLQKLETTRRRIWLDVQKQVAIMISALDLSTARLSVFLRILGHIRRLIDIGEDFSKITATVLDEAIRSRTLSYVFAHHRRTLERAKVFLEKDKWEAVAVNPNFNFLKLKEFAFLRKPKELSRNASKSDIPGDAAANPTPTPRKEKGPLDRFAADQEMFHTARNAPEDSDAALPDLDDESSDHTNMEDMASASTTDESKPAEKRMTPIHCSHSALYFVRCFGRYMHMMDVLKSIASEVFMCLKELFDFYIFTVINFFGDKNFYPLLDGKPQLLLRRLQNAIPERSRKDSAAGASAPIPLLPPGANQSSSSLRSDEFSSPLQDLGLPKLCADVSLTQPVNLYGLPARVTGAESMSFLATAMRSLLKYLKERLSDELIKAYFSGTVDQVIQLKWFIYKSNAGKLFSPAHLVSEMERTKWDLKEQLDVPNPYIESLSNELTILKGRFNSLGEARVPQMAANILWTEVITQLNSALVDGFASARKCTLPGRGQMQHDYKELQGRLRVCTAVKLQSDFIEDYIRAYYLQDDELQLWIEEHHKNYSMKQLTSLINVAYAPRKAAKTLLQLLTQLKKDETRRTAIPDI